MWSQFSSTLRRQVVQFLVFDSSRAPSPFSGGFAQAAFHWRFLLPLSHFSLPLVLSCHCFTPVGFPLHHFLLTVGPWPGGGAPEASFQSLWSPAGPHPLACVSQLWEVDRIPPSGSRYSENGPLCFPVSTWGCSGAIRRPALPPPAGSLAPQSVATGSFFLPFCTL